MMAELSSAESFGQATIFSADTWDHKDQLCCDASGTVLDTKLPSGRIGAPGRDHVDADATWEDRIEDTTRREAQSLQRTPPPLEQCFKQRWKSVHEPALAIQPPVLLTCRHVRP
ncbi:hypothetical protein CSUB01_04604 [Colletotrichum sublineola]|uniref:Uncharacterized protein n=1 Tax=Colletotrichum sublineola TaxID=1173701 RepID=A0A066X974_COLSU|nr:hypothetical protein CSUB01_04604 [Colletotrichum sublineola]